MKKLNQLTKKQFNDLKSIGMLLEFYPKAPESYEEMRYKLLHNHITDICMDILLPSNSEKVPGEERLPNISSVRDLINNYKSIKKRFPQQKIDITIEVQISKNRKETIKITLTELKKMSRIHKEIY